MFYLFQDFLVFFSICSIIQASFEIQRSNSLEWINLRVNINFIFIKMNLLNKAPRVFRVPRVPKWPSSARMRKCLSAFSARAPQVLVCPSALSAQVLLEYTWSALGVPFECSSTLWVLFDQKKSATILEIDSLIDL